MRYKALSSLLVVGLLLVGTGLIHAMTGGAVSSYTFSCTDVSITYGQIEFGRDNTGAGNESYTFVIVDGAGNTVVSYSSYYAVGDFVSAQTEVFPFTSAPVQNPLRVQLYSNAGNGLPQQSVWDFMGNSPCLPAASACNNGAPDGAVLRTLLYDTPAYFEANLSATTGFNIPAGTWYTYDVTGDFTHLWVTCGANPVWVSTSALN